MIGTHRVLSQDVKFKDLGLLVIDEEQRFGVQHKGEDQEIKGKCGRDDPDGNTNPPDPPYEA